LWGANNNGLIRSKATPDLLGKTAHQAFLGHKGCKGLLV
jgi:hypothetical protein